MQKAKYLLLLSFLFSPSLRAQTWNVDDASEYKIDRSDIILKVRIINSFYMTDVMTYQCEVLSVQKRNYPKKEVVFEIVYPGNSEQIRKLRMDALVEGDTVLVGFRKNPSMYMEGIKIGSVDYAYFMSEKK